MLGYYIASTPYSEGDGRHSGFGNGHGNGYGDGLMAGNAYSHGSGQGYDCGNGAKYRRVQPWSLTC